MIEIQDYNAAWPVQFAGLRDRLSSCLGTIALAIEHVGSTSVPGLAAKPILELDVVIASREDLPAVIERLACVGYGHRGDLGIEDREVFAAPADGPRHHLYVCTRNSLALRNHLALRDHLRTHTQDAERYAALKRQLALCCDIDEYTRRKTDFLLAILERCGFSATEICCIREANLG